MDKNLLDIKLNYIYSDFKEEYEEYFERQSQDREDEKLLKSKKHEILTNKIRIYKTFVDSKIQERQQIVDHNQELLKTKEKIIINEKLFSFLSNDKGKVKSLDKLVEDNENRKRRLDDTNNQTLHQLDIMCQNYENETFAIESNCIEYCSERGGFSGNNCGNDDIDDYMIIKQLKNGNNDKARNELDVDNNDNH